MQRKFQIELIQISKTLNPPIKKPDKKIAKKIQEKRPKNIKEQKNLKEKDNNRHIIQTIAKKKIFDLRNKNPKLSNENIKLATLLNLKNRIGNNFAIARKKKNIPNLKELNWNYLLASSKKDRVDSATQSNIERLNRLMNKDPKNFKYSFENLRNLREKYMILKEKIFKQSKQTHERKLDYAEFKLKVKKFEKLITDEMKNEMKDFTFQSEADTSFDGSSRSLNSAKINGKKKKISSGNKFSIWEKIDRRNKIAKNLLNISQAENSAKGKLSSSKINF